ncbi:hypothetical protein [Tahibacter amnicola]|uniref:Uncharacterized protein n=1 Tax=Tahibacter amnicola TaxID=2976241 RepID=A0ABY6BJY9_9GAMM|nr:hypothetical protein [Tahibacter amnicola]UXI70089.1 hypothetical protein N4264_10810 [Tahibacter amnicola]
MNIANAYACLVHELEVLRQYDPQDLIPLVGSAPLEQVLDIAGERVEFSYSMSWADRHRRAIRITAQARGPSTWRHEWFEESATVAVPPRASEPP